MTSTYKVDYKYGRDKEVELYKQIKEKFDADLEPAKERFALFDFNSKDTSVELKSRRVLKNQYKDTMIGINKIYCANKYPEKSFYFCFNFLDGLYYFKHSKNYTYNIRFGGHPEAQKTYAFIPVEDLLPI